MDPAIENDTNRPIQQVRRLVQSSIRRVEGISNDPITDSDLLVRAYGQVVEIMSTTSRELQCQLQILKDQKLRMDQAEKTASSQIQANLTAHIAKLAEIEHQKEEELRKSQEKSISNEELSQKLIGLTRSVSTLEAAEKATNNGVVYLQTLVEKLVRDDELRGNLGKAHENLGKERSEVSRLNAALGEERAEVSRMKTALDEEAETRRRTECLHREANSNLYRRLASMIMTGRENAILLRQTQDRNRYSEAQLKEIQPPRDTISEREKTIQVKDQELQDLRTQKSKAEGDLREVMESKEKEIDRITSEVEGKVLKAEERVQAFQRKIREVEEKAQRAEEKVLEAEKRARDSERKTQEAKSSLHQAEERTRASESKIREAEEKVRNFERSLYQAELRVQEAEASAKAAEENAMGKSKLASPTTSVEDDSFNSQDEIHMSKKRKLNQGTPNDPRQIDFDDALSNLMDLLGSFRVIGQTKISLVFPELLDCFGKPNAKENFQAYLGIPDRSSWVCLQWVVKRGRRTPHIIMGDTHCMECTKASKRCIQVKGEAQDEEVSKTLVRVVTSNGF